MGGLPTTRRAGGEALSHYESLAKNVIKKSLRIRPKENVIVESWNHGADVAKEIVYQLRAAGARPMFLFEDEDTHWRSVETLPPARLGQVSKSEWAALKEADAYIFLPGPADIARYRKNLGKTSVAFGYNSNWYRIAEKSGLRGARLLLGYVSPERAASYGFDFDAWRSMLLDASAADFAAVARKGKKIAGLLSSDARVEISSPNGTRLSFDLRGRPGKADDGIVDEQDVEDGDFMTNVPPGYSYVVPDEKSAEGTIVADLPVAYLGSLMRGIRVDFTGGKASWSAEVNPELLRPSWEKAKGPKDLLGALSIGLNPAARTGFLQDDLVAGVVEVGIGSNDEYGGRNKTDFYLGARLSNATVKVGKKVLVDGGQLAV